MLLYYARNSTLWLAVWGNYEVDQDHNPFNYTVTAAREFRYDNPRQRYMSRDYDVSGGPDPLALGNARDLARLTRRATINGSDGEARCPDPVRADFA